MMPPLCPTSRCSAHLQARMSANPPSHPTASKQKAKVSTVTQPGNTQAVILLPKPSRSTTTPVQCPSTSTSHGEDSLPSITWDKGSAPHTEKLLSWLQSHPADQVVLFHAKKTTQERSSSRLKKDIHAVIAKHLFSTCTIYSSAYASHPKQFTSSVSN